MIYEYPSSADGEAEYEGEPNIDDDEMMEYDEPDLD